MKWASCAKAMQRASLKLTKLPDKRGWMIHVFYKVGVLFRCLRFLHLEVSSEILEDETVLPVILPRPGLSTKSHSAQT